MRLRGRRAAAVAPIVICIQIDLVSDILIAYGRNAISYRNVESVAHLWAQSDAFVFDIALNGAA